MRGCDEHDRAAERLFDMIRKGCDDQKVISAIAKALRNESKAAFERGRIVGFAEGMR